MATQFSELQKLLINVADNKCDAFIKAHVNNTWPLEESDENPRPSELPEFTAGENDKYYNKVVFLQKYNAIYTKGTFFGYSGDLKDDLTHGISANGITVVYDPVKHAIVTSVAAATYDKDSDTWDDIDNVVTASTVQSYVDAKVAGAVAEATAAMNFRGPITADNFTTKQSEASNGDVYVVSGTNSFTLNGETFEVGDLVIFGKDGDAAATYTVVERNLDGAVTVGSTFTEGKILIAGEGQTAYTTGYTAGSGTFATTGDSSYILATEAGVNAAISGAIGTIVHEDGEGEGTYMTYTYHTTYGITYIDSIAPVLAEYTVSTNALGDVTLDNTEPGLVDHEALNTVIEYLDGKIDDVDCVVTTLTEVSDSDYFSVTEDSVDTDNDLNYTIKLKVVNLGDAVGMTYDETTGKWSAPEGNPDAKNGLASAADVANELVSDEKVIAAALNDHEARLDVLEAFADDINGTIQDQLVIGDVKVTGLTAEVVETGLVNAQLLVDVINALDPWEDYE